MFLNHFDETNCFPKSYYLIDSSHDEGSSKVNRTLVLDENDLVLVVDKEVVKQVDENRGEMNRSEFVNLLIHTQLNKYYANQNYIDREEFYRVVREIKELQGNFLDFVLSLELSKQSPDDGFEKWCQKIQALDGFGDKDTNPVV